MNKTELTQEEINIYIEYLIKQSLEGFSNAEKGYLKKYYEGFRPQTNFKTTINYK